MMELGSGIAVAGFFISGGAVSITAIRTFGTSKTAANGKNGANGKDGLDAIFPCKDHSGIVVCLENIEKGQDRHETWLSEISKDVKSLLKK